MFPSAYAPWAMALYTVIEHQYPAVYPGVALLGLRMTKRGLSLLKTRPLFPQVADSDHSAMYIWLIHRLRIPRFASNKGMYLCR